MEPIDIDPPNGFDETEPSSVRESAQQEAFENSGLSMAHPQDLQYPQSDYLPEAPSQAQSSSQNQIDQGRPHQISILNGRGNGYLSTNQLINGSRMIAEAGQNEVSGQVQILRRPVQDPLGFAGIIDLASNSNNFIQNLDKAAIPVKIPSKSMIGRVASFCHSTKSKLFIANCCAFIFMATLLPVLVTLMVFHFTNKENLSSTSDALDYISLNLNSDPITQIIGVNSTSNCPDGFALLKLGSWPGTNNGCNCPELGIERGYCQKKEDIICTDVSDIEEIELFGWGGSTWCAKRAQPENEYLKASKCPSGFKECVAGLCMKESLDCPITSISLTKDNTVSAIKMEGSELYLKPYRNMGESPLIDVDITLNNIPCFSLNKMPRGVEPYVLLNDFPTGCDKYGLDEKYSFEIDRGVEERVLKDNNLPSKIFDLPGYEQSLESTLVVLSGRRRITVSNNDRCLKIDMNLLEEARSASDAIRTSVTACSIVALVFHCLMIFTLFMVVLNLSKEHSWVDLIRGVGPKIWFNCFAYLGFFENIIYLVMFSLICSYRVELMASNNYLMEVKALQCFESWQPKTVISDYQNNSVESTYILFIFAILLAIISLLTYISAIVFNIYRKK